MNQKVERLEQRTARLWSQRFVVLGILLVAGCSPEKNTAVEETKPVSLQGSVDDVYITTSSETAKRAASVLPTKGSEDVSSLLAPLDLEIPADEEPRDYLPSEAAEWIVHAKPETALTSKEVSNRFDYEWSEKYGGPVIYGRCTKDRHWTYVRAPNGPEEVDDLQFAWRYFRPWSDETHAPTCEDYAARLDAIKERLGKIANCKVYATLTPEDAVKRVDYLRNLTRRLDRDVTIRLLCPKGERFDGKEIWDVMLCLGLTWGDMDCFHWINSAQVGADFIFSVWTSTPPGYFLPEQIAAGRVAVEDLVFCYSIPRSADPEAVFARMMGAVQYAQKRLGGTIADADGCDFDEAATREEVRRITVELKKAGFVPGTDDALIQF